VASSDSGSDNLQRPASVLAESPDIPRAGQSIWIRRITAIIYVLFSVELGILLVLLPWKEVWTDNSFFIAYPELRLWLNHNFVRGAVSGLGLINIWIGVWDAAHYRERRSPH
jgi:hypothetical protein